MLKSVGLLAASHICQTISNHISNRHGRDYQYEHEDDERERQHRDKQMKRALILQGSATLLLMLHNYLNEEEQEELEDYPFVPEDREEWIDDYSESRRATTRRLGEYQGYDLSPPPPRNRARRTRRTRTRRTRTRTPTPPPSRRLRNSADDYLYDSPTPTRPRSSRTVLTNETDTLFLSSVTSTPTAYNDVSSTDDAVYLSSPYVSDFESERHFFTNPSPSITDNDHDNTSSPSPITTDRRATTRNTNNNMPSPHHRASNTSTTRQRRRRRDNEDQQQLLTFELNSEEDAKPRRGGHGPFKQCTICMESLRSSKFSLPTPRCEHESSTCRQCLRRWYAISERFETTKCIHPDCPEEIQIVDASLWVPLKERVQYINNIDSNLIHRGVILNSMNGRRENIIYCSNNHCNNLFISDHHTNNEQQQRAIKCTECNTSTCLSCHGTWSFQHQLHCTVLNGYQQSVHNIKTCPNCRMGVQKNGGCDHMTCDTSVGGCGTEFCWICFADYNGVNGIHSVGNSAHAATCRYYA